jgi:signal transduction histidine kinase
VTGHGPQWTRPSSWSTARTTAVSLVLIAAVSVAVVGGAAVIIAHRIARADALSEGLRTARGVGQALLMPVMPAVVAGDEEAAADLDAAIAQRRADGTLLRVTVWRRDGTIVWSDDQAIIGRRRTLEPRETAVFDQRRDFARITSLDQADEAAERAVHRNLVEAYIPLRLGDGSTVALEMYFSDDRVRAAEDEDSERLVVFSLGVLLVLALGQLPVSIWLVRRTGRARQDRDRMRGAALVSSERERRMLARNLHDGVVQELAGAAYVLESKVPTGPLPPETVRAMGVVTGTLRQAVDDLREMLVELHPAELTSANLANLVAASAARTCPRQEVSVTVELDRPLPPEFLTFLYRSARECAVNVAKHADADAVDITITSDPTGVRLAVRDDGIGIPDPLPRTAGHLGLTLLRTAAAELGGSLEAAGTTVTIVLPPPDATG